MPASRNSASAALGESPSQLHIDLADLIQRDAVGVIDERRRCGVFSRGSKGVALAAMMRNGAASKSTSAASMASMLVPEIRPR